MCNIALNGLENAVCDSLPFPNSKEGRKISGSWVIRYANNFIVTSPCRDRLVQEHIPRVIFFLSERGVQVSEKKSKIINLEKERFNFLGWEISLKSRNPTRNKYNSSNKVLIIKPSKKSIKRFKGKIKALFRLNKPIRAIVKDLNPLFGVGRIIIVTLTTLRKFFNRLGHYTYQLW